MWDSAKKPIKIRSVLQSNGMRHFFVNEESEELYTTYLRQQQTQRKGKSKPLRPPQDAATIRPDKQLQQNLQPSEKDETVNKKDKHSSGPVNLQRSNSIGEWSERSFENENEFFGVAGSKINNSKKHKGLHPHSRHLCNFRHPVKDNTFMQLKNGLIEVPRCPHLRSEILDFIPVKSPVIKKLISGRTGSTSSSRSGFSNVSHHLNNGSIPQQGASSTTLCSRIMTWIDLEVKRNAGGKGSSSGALSFNSADLNIVNELALPSFDMDSPGSSSSSSTTSSESEGGSNSSSGSGTTSYGSSSSVMSSPSNESNSLSVSLPKLVPCWKKDVSGRSKKSVRIADDLPKWGEMKQRLKKKDRSFSLNELREDHGDNLHERKSGRRQNGNSALDLTNFGNGENDSFENEEKRETDNFLVCDETSLTGTGRLQVHIFLPQMKSAASTKCSPANTLNLNSEESTTT